MSDFVDTGENDYTVAKGDDFIAIGFFIWTYWSGKGFMARILEFRENELLISPFFKTSHGGSRGWKKVEDYYNKERGQYWRPAAERYDRSQVKTFRVTDFTYQAQQSHTAFYVAMEYGAKQVIISLHEPSGMLSHPRSHWDRETAMGLNQAIMRAFQMPLGKGGKKPAAKVTGDDGTVSLGAPPAPRSGQRGEQPQEHVKEWWEDDPL